MWREFRYFTNIGRFKKKVVNVEKLEIRIDMARITDTHVIQHVLKSVYNGKSPWSTSILWLELSRKYKGIYLKALDYDRVIGFIGVRLEENRDAHITNLAVLPEYQQQGIGTNLIREACLYAERNQCLTVSLEVKKSNLIAINAYKKMGFEVRGVKPGYYQENGEDAIDMLLSLKGGKDT